MSLSLQSTIRHCARAVTKDNLSESCKDCHPCYVGHLPYMISRNRQNHVNLLTMNFLQPGRLPISYLIHLSHFMLCVCTYSNLFIPTQCRDSSVGIVTATGWTIEGSEFESRWGQEFSFLHVAHPVFYRTWLFLRGKAAGA
jgi:hypothetical protein